MDRPASSNFTTAFDTVLADAGIRTVLCNMRTPRMNCFAEKWIRTVRAECTDRMLICSEAHLRAALRTYAEHYKPSTITGTGRTSPGAGGHLTKTSRPSFCWTHRCSVGRYSAA
jgi:hypothetical protein